MTESSTVHTITVTSQWDTKKVSAIVASTLGAFDDDLRKVFNSAENNGGEVSYRTAKLEIVDNKLRLSCRLDTAGLVAVSGDISKDNARCLTHTVYVTAVSSAPSEKAAKEENRKLRSVLSGEGSNPTLVITKYRGVTLEKEYPTDKEPEEKAQTKEKKESTSASPELESLLEVLFGGKKEYPRSDIRSDGGIFGTIFGTPSKSGLLDEVIRTGRESRAHNSTFRSEEKKYVRKTAPKENPPKENLEDTNRKGRSGDADHTLKLMSVRDAMLGSLVSIHEDTYPREKVPSVTEMKGYSQMELLEYMAYLGVEIQVSVRESDDTFKKNLKEGTKVRTVRELDMLPVGTVIQEDNKDTRHVASKHNDGIYTNWLLTGSGHRLSSDSLLSNQSKEWRVILVGTD